MFERIKTAITNCNEAIMDKFGEKKSDICVIGGAISVIAGVFFCCKATLECDEILDEHHALMDKVHEAAEIEPAYAENGRGRDTAKVFGRTCWRVFRRFAPGVGLVGGGLYLMAKGYGMVKEDKANLVVAYNSLLAAYQTRMSKEPYECETVEFENGDILPIHKKDGDLISIDMIPDDYIIPFNRNNNNFHTETKWGPDADYWNYNFLNFKRRELMRMLHAKGKIYLIDALELLGVPDADIPNEHVARVTGWIDDSRKDDGEAMNDYNFFTVVKDDVHPECCGTTIWLRFNVDGIILGRDI